MAHTSWLDRSVVFSFDRTGFRRHARRFASEPERDLRGADVLITGGTAGIGLGVAEALAGRGARCTLWARRAEVGEPVAASLGGRFTGLDLADLPSVAAAAHAADLPRLAGVALNAGAMPLQRTLTAQGHELMWASQVLGHLLLVRILRARGLLGPEARVVWVASGGLYTQRLDLSDLTWAERPYRRHVAYANAKRAQLLLSQHLAAAWPEVPMACMHPGWVATEAVARSMPVFHALTRPILRDRAAGADTVAWLIAREAPPEPGRFWFDRAVVPEHLRAATREAAADRDALVAQAFADTDPYLQREASP
jgi:dehydrogenase/reductase SDR family protein 12